MKIVLLVPDGMGFRNFLLTTVLERLAARDTVVVWHALPAAIVEATRPVRSGQVQPVVLPPYAEGAAARILRQAKIYAQIYHHAERDAGEVLLAFRRPSRAWRPRLVATAARTLGHLFASGAGAGRLHRWHARAVRGRSLTAARAWLEQARPDVVLSTHQRASRAVPAMLAARRLGIPSATCVYSWDNLPKGRMAVHADHVLVWSAAMRQELLRYEPERDPSSVHVVGTPQFGPHFERQHLLPRQVFLDRHRLEQTRPVLCFSGDDRATSPHDPLYLRDLAETLATVPRAARPQILFRPCPVDDAERYRAVLDAHPEIAFSPPRWQSGRGDWTTILPTDEDQALFANVVAHCDGVINVGSTVAMDFAIKDKPGIFLAYNPPGAGDWDVGRLYRLPHFATVHRLEPVHWVTRREELGPVVLDALAHPAARQAARQAWLAAAVAQPLEHADRRFAQALHRIAARRQAP